MKYKKIVKGNFVSRPNRFVANVAISGKETICHVKNTGRCRELLIPGAEVFLEESNNPARKTKYDLVGVKKGDLMINMDSQAPNKAVAEWLKKKILFPDLTYLKAEQKYGTSRFDFYLEAGERKVFLEVKGVTLEEDGAAYFPDAPTQRGVRHIRELISCMQDGFEGVILFVIQMKQIRQFCPNDRTHPEFGAALREAWGAGVKVLAYDCLVTEDSMELDKEIPVVLHQ